MNTMPWKCLDCRETFDGPTDRSPENGCPHCGSRQCLDINVTPAPMTDAERAAVYRGLETIDRANRFQLMFGRPALRP